MHRPSDELLVEQARRGSHEAFAQIVQRRQGSVYSLCYHLTGDRAEAEDLAQESFLRLYRSLGKFRPGAPLAPWLRKITANVCLDALRRRGEATLPLDEILGGAAEPPSRSEDELPEEALLRGEARRAVRSGLCRLPGDYRVVLILRYLEDLTYQEIADALGVPLSTVETRLFRARKLLARILASSTEDRPSSEEGKEGDRRGLHVERGAGL